MSATQLHDALYGRNTRSLGRTDFARSRSHAGFHLMSVRRQTTSPKRKLVANWVTGPARIYAGGMGKLRECIVRLAMQLVWTVGRQSGKNTLIARDSNWGSNSFKNESGEQE